MRGIVKSFTLTAVVTLSAWSACAQPWSPQPFTPIPQLIHPFGYGTVSQFLSTSSSSTGNAICAMHSQLLKCFEVSGSGSCQSSLTQGVLVSCGLSANPPVDETNFQPVNCNGHGTGDGGVSGLMTPSDWCLITGYMPTRKQNTIYQFDDYVRLGVNLLYGGTIFELYGTDKVDRILQNGGGAVQLSLWAFSPQYANPAYQRGYFEVPNYGTGQCNMTNYPTLAECTAANGGRTCGEGVAGPNVTSCPNIYPCGGNGATAGSSINPIQAQSQNCTYGSSNAAVDTVVAKAPGRITVTKTDPSNFTRSDTYPVTWSQTTQVVGPYAMVTYHVSTPTLVADTDFQEIPAIFLHGGIGAQIYYYAGTAPYADVSGPVSLVNELTAPPASALQLPNRPGPFGVGAVANLTEDWMSSCDVGGTKCITVASFSSLAQDFIAEYNPSTSYMGIHSFFSITQGASQTFTIFIFPYRFDDVVMGMSIRAWIYQLHQNRLYRR